MCGPFTQDGNGRAETIIDRIPNGAFHRELVKANHAVIDTLMSGESDVDTIAARTGIDDGMMRAVLANADVFDVETFMDEPTVLVSAKLTPYGRTLGHYAHDDRIRRLPRVHKNVPCPKCRKEHMVSVIEGAPVPSYKTYVGAVICNGCCGFMVDAYGRVYQ